MTALQATLRDRDGIAVIDLRGDIDRAADEQLATAYERARRDGAQTVALNFEQTDYINSSGIAVIVALLARTRGDGVALCAFGLSEHYREIFEITRLADYITIAGSEDLAVGQTERSGNG
ncbi:MAG: anti-sigma factor antagonist [Solirubrobacteraceae bacterium]|jgi:anti-anti-sigma factor|nr:anti-sigma factor antagonist [Solirubrobacteraceae bacterium]